MFTLDVGAVTTISFGEDSKLVFTARTGVWSVVSHSVSTLHSPVVDTVVVDSISQRHLLVKQQTILTGLQTHDSILTLVESVAGVWVSVHLIHENTGNTR